MDEEQLNDGIRAVIAEAADVMACPASKAELLADPFLGGEVMQTVAMLVISERARNDALRSKLAALREAFEDVRDTLHDLPGGIDEEADPENCSPEDAVAHLGGLMVQRIDAALAAAKEE